MIILTTSQSSRLTIPQDDPRQRPADPDPEWVLELQKLVKCKKILQSANNDLKVECSRVSIFDSSTNLRSETSSTLSHQQ